MGSPYKQPYLSVLTVGQWQLADRNNCTAMPFNHNYQHGTKTLYGAQKFITGEVVFGVTVTGLTGCHDLSERTIPTQRDFPLKTVVFIGLTD